MAGRDGFLQYSRLEAPQRELLQRIGDYGEVELSMPEDTLRQQAARCMDCGIPFCHGSGCPVANRIPDMNDRVMRGRWREAADLLHSMDNFPEITGRICPAPCESACTLGIHGDAVAIRSVERLVADRAWEEGWVVPLPPARRTGRRVAVVGSGPAGLAAAQQLARLGHEVVVFERDLRLGGLLRYGIPDFKLPKDLIDRRIAQMEAEGVSFVRHMAIGDETSFRCLESQFEATVLAVGAGVPRDLQAPGRELGGIHFAMDYLVRQNRRNAGEEVPDPINAAGLRVLVLGGGDTGSDCIGTAQRQGAREIHQVELLPKPTASPIWPAHGRRPPKEEAGVARHWGLRTELLEGAGGRVTRWHGVATATGETLSLEVDLVILAMGFLHLEHGGLVERLGLELDPRGNLRALAEGRTSRPGIFAAGDAMLGPSLVVRAIQTGREAAAAADRYLKG